MTYNQQSTDFLLEEAQALIITFEITDEQLQQDIKLFHANPDINLARNILQALLPFSSEGKQDNIMLWLEQHRDIHIPYNFRYYLEYRTHADLIANREHTGNVLAIQAWKGAFEQKIGNHAILCYNVIGNITTLPNSPVQPSTLAFSYLRKYCKQVSTSHARRIHPTLFAYLEERFPIQLRKDAHDKLQTT